MGCTLFIARHRKEVKTMKHSVFCKAFRTNAVCVLLACALAGSLVGCGSSAGSSASTAAASPAYAMANGSTASTDTALVESADEGTWSSDCAAYAPTERKIIRNASLTMETLDFDSTVSALLDAVQQTGGYVSEADVRTPTGDSAMRRAYYTLRIPAEQYSSFLAGAGEAGTVLNKTESTEDVTSDYVDIEARLKSLRLQEERLYAMMEQAGELDTLLAIQNQLTEVQYRIESYTSVQRTYDDLVDYSTITITLSEVQRATNTSSTFGQRMVSAFSESWYSFGEIFAVLCIGLAFAFPFLLVAGAIVLAVRRYQRSHPHAAPTQSAPAKPVQIPAEYQPSNLNEPHTASDTEDTTEQK
jgi:hypothetical protein